MGEDILHEALRALDLFRGRARLTRRRATGPGRRRHNDQHQSELEVRLRIAMHSNERLVDEVSPG